jgi:hypothetical protein
VSSCPARSEGGVNSQSRRGLKDIHCVGKGIHTVTHSLGRRRAGLGSFRRTRPRPSPTSYPRPGSSSSAGPMRGLSVTLMGCGQGNTYRILAPRGTKITRVEWSNQHSHPFTDRR